MQEKRLKVWKRVTALLMSAILVAVSLPLALAAPLSAGTYDPTPTFAEDATLWAWETEEGDVTVSVPEATVNTEYITKSIATYYITLYDLGVYTQVHDDPATEDVPSAKITRDATTVTFAVENTFEVTFPAEQLESAGITMDGTHRLSVEVLAQDSTGWVSDAITTTVSDVPRFEYDEEAYTPLVENATGMREMLMFEARNNNNMGYVSDNGAGGGRLDYIASSSAGANQLSFYGQAPYAGDDGSGAYRFQVVGTGDQSFNTTWSRQHWIAEDAEEIWFWFDFSQVSVEGLAFELKTQGKRYEEYYWDDLWGQGVVYLYGSINDDDYSTVTYSTKGYTGNDGYVYIQADDGSWESVALENGGIDLANYKGYIRVPVQFICSTTPTYAEARNDNFGFGGNGLAEDLGGGNESGKKAQFDNNVLLSEQVLVDPAGTPISEALLLQYRQLSIDIDVNEFGGNSSADEETGNPNNSVYTMPYHNDYPSTGANHYAALERPNWGASMLAVGPSRDDCNTDMTNKAYVQLNADGTVYKDAEGNAVILNRENGYKALDDICGAGFSYTNMSADSVNHSFYMDSVMFYKSEGNYPQDMTEGEYGLPLTNYYDQTTEIPRAILNQIDALITFPDEGDYRAVQYISEMLDGYRQGYAGSSVGNDFLSEENLAATAASLGLTSVWEKFTTARDLCVEAGTIIQNDDGTYTYPSNNDTGYENAADEGATGLVAQLVRSLEKLPDPSTVSSVSDALEVEIVRAYSLYTRLSLAQLNALSLAEEQKLLEYVALVGVDSSTDLDVAGNTLARNKFVLFNDFESLSIGTESDLFENDPNGMWRYGDYRYTKGFLTYGSTTRTFLGTWDNSQLDANSPSAGNYADPMQNGTIVDGTERGDTLINGTKATVTDAGFNGTHGAAVTINSSYYNGGGSSGGNGNGMYNILSVSLDSYSALDGDNNDAMTHNMGIVNLGDVLEGPNGNAASSTFPLGLVFYADFSQLSDFKLTASITTGSHRDGSGTNDFTLAMGDSEANKSIYLMDMRTGEWVDCSASGHGANYFSSDVTTNGLTLAGYEGYIMIPLYQFKDNWTQATTGGTGAVKLSEYAAGLNSIYRVNIGIAPDNSAASSDALEGKTFVIDNIGFGYTSDYNTGTTVHSTFGEVLGVPSQYQNAFEEAVAALEPSAANSTAWSTEFMQALNNAQLLYNALTDAEKGFHSTQQAYTQLQAYQNATTEEISAYTAAWTPSTLFNTYFANLGLSGTLAVADGNTSGEYDLPYPGVVDTDGTDGTADAVNYAAYGLTAESAAQIIEWYNNSYSKWTQSQKDQFPEQSRQFLNAYNAAMRCVSSLEPALTQSLTFLGSLYTGGTDALYQTMSQLYPDRAATGSLGVAGDGNVYPTSGTYDKTKPYGSWTENGATVNEGFFISVSDENIATLETALTNFNRNNNYFAKVLMADGSIRDGAENVSEACEKLLNNTDTYTNASGQTVNGGVVQLLDKYQTQYEDAAQKMADGTFTATDRTNLLNTIAEYESLIATYHDVAELYDVIQQMYDLFPLVTGTWTAGTAGDAQTHNLLLAYDGTSSSVTADTSAVYTLTQLESYLNDTTGTSTLTITSSNGGVLSDGAGTELAYTLTNNGSEVTLTSGSATLPSSTSTGSALATISATVSSPASYATVLTDTVTLTYTYQYTDRNGIKREVVDERYLVISYATDDFYTVTVPAGVQIDWGTTTVSNIGLRADSTGFSASGNLSGDAYISVDSEPAAATLTMSAADTAETISVSAQGSYNNEYSGSFSNSDGSGAMLTIDSSEWENKPLAEYRATDAITYTVTYSDGSTTP